MHEDKVCDRLEAFADEVQTKRIVGIVVERCNIAMSRTRKVGICGGACIRCCSMGGTTQIRDGHRRRN